MLIALFTALAGAAPSYEQEVQPIFDHYCVSCHACYDAPCQLNLTDPEGVQRGLIDTSVYGARRTHAAPTTRLFEDAESTTAWRALGFSPVLAPDAARSLLWASIAQGSAHPLPEDQPPPEDLSLRLGHSLTCPLDVEAYQAFAAEHPSHGMPYAMARLPAEALHTVQAWLEAGAPFDTVRPLPSTVELQGIEAWEAFLNAEGAREALVARYLYEHLFLAQLYFGTTQRPQFYRMVRSATPPGEPVEQRPTRLPNLPLEGEVYYRFVPVRGTRVRKSHLPLPLTPDVLRGLQDLFLGAEWQTTPEAVADYTNATNPFITFADIPQSIRYRFLLERSHFFISNFIRGPVCRGPIAINVIPDRFFVSFLDPAHDVPSDLVSHQTQALDPPRDVLTQQLIAEAKRNSKSQRAWLKAKDKALKRQLPEGRPLEHLWTGHENSRLTVFRHRDSATVVRGWVGTEPDTLWVMDYPLLERTYYTLVANFDVFGTLAHQTTTRMYFDRIRAESEDNFLLFLPPQEREQLRYDWYRGPAARLKQRRQYIFSGGSLPGATDWAEGSAKSQFIEHFATLSPLPAGVPDDLAPLLVAMVDRPQPFIQYMPEHTVLHLVVDGSPERDIVLSLLRDRAFRNQSFMLGEQGRAEPERDRLTVVPGVLGDYPNRIFRVPVAQGAEFLRALSLVQSTEDYQDLLTAWGVRRTSPVLFDEAELLYRQDSQRRPLRAGRFDLYRYGSDLLE